MDVASFYDWQSVCEALAAEPPWWEPGTAHGYHARTFGFLLGEILQRATGQPVSEWFATHIANPHDVDFYFGVPTADLERCADMLPARMRPGEERNWPPHMRAMTEASRDPSTPTWSAFQNPSPAAPPLKGNLPRDRRSPRTDVRSASLISALGCFVIPAAT